jgi:hypothetical protein
MYNDIVVVNKIEHKDKNVKEVKDFSFSKKLTSITVTIAEFYEACKNYPIFFAKDAEDKWFASVMLGYRKDENIFVNEKGVWEKLHYIPANIRRYPFIFVKNEENDDLILAIEKEYLSDNEKDIERKLFKDDNNSELLNQIMSFLEQFYVDSLGTQEFIKQLDELELLEEKVATVKNEKNEVFNINGFYVVNEEKLNHLSKKKKEEICNKNIMPLITAHLLSLSNLQKLGRF